MWTRPEQALIRNRGRRSFNHVCSTLQPRGRVPFRRSYSSPFRVLNQNPRRETFRLARAHQKKGANKYFPATRARSSRETLGVEYPVELPSELASFSANFRGFFTLVDADYELCHSLHVLRLHASPGRFACP